jgi:hypothetical protein
VRAVLSGALAAGFLVVALHFARFWKEGGDRLFLYFAVAFSLLGINAVALGLSSPQGDFRVAVYGVRLAAFVVILYAIWDKNRS